MGASPDNIQGNPMTRFHTIALTALLGALTLTGCGSMSRSQVSTVTGAAVGAVVGGAVGGTAATAAGAVIGGVVGNEIDKKR